MKRAEPFADEHAERAEVEASAEERLADRIRALAALVLAEQPGWTPARLAAAVGKEPASGTFTRALKLLQDAGEWEATGATKSRRWRPVDSRHSRQPLGNGEIGLNGDGPQQAFACSCASPAEPAPDGRCSRCWGAITNEEDE